MDGEGVSNWGGDGGVLDFIPIYNISGNKNNNARTGGARLTDSSSYNEQAIK